MRRAFLIFIYRYVIPYGGLLLVKALSVTYRIRILDPENEQGVLDRRGSLVYASWHQRFFPGITFFSQRKPIVPTLTSAEKKWVFNSWDRFMVPKPFSRVVIRFGEPIEIPAELDGDAFEQKRLFVEQRMQELYAETDRIWLDTERIRTAFE